MILQEVSWNYKPGTAYFFVESDIGWLGQHGGNLGYSLTDYGKNALNVHNDALDLPHNFLLKRIKTPTSQYASSILPLLAC